MGESPAFEIRRAAAAMREAPETGEAPAWVLLVADWLDAVVEFADPHIRYGLRFQAPDAHGAAEPLAAEPPAAAEGDPPAAKDPEPGQVVSLDAFRRRSPQG